MGLPGRERQKGTMNLGVEEAPEEKEKKQDMQGAR